MSNTSKQSWLEILRKTSFPPQGGEEGYVLFISVLYLWFTAAIAHALLHLSYPMAAVNGLSGCFLLELVIFRYVFNSKLSESVFALLPYIIESALVIAFIYVTGGFASLFLPLGAVYLLLVYQYSSAIAFKTAAATTIVLGFLATVLVTFRWVPQIPVFYGQKGVQFLTLYHQLTFLTFGLLLVLGWLYGRIFKRSSSQPVSPPPLGQILSTPPIASGGPWAVAKEVLSEREMEIILEAYNGLTNKEIASKLTIQEDTVKSHLNKAYKKLNVKNRVQLIKYFSSGIVPIEKGKE